MSKPERSNCLMFLVSNLITTEVRQLSNNNLIYCALSHCLYLFKISQNIIVTYTPVGILPDGAPNTDRLNMLNIQRIMNTNESLLFYDNIDRVAANQ